MTMVVSFPPFKNRIIIVRMPSQRLEDRAEKSSDLNALLMALQVDTV
jgi:hypothetical protein